MAGAALLGVLSRGSRNHAELRCRPCVYNASSQSCPRGEECNLCHYAHDVEKIQEALKFSIDKACRNRTRKAKRERKAAPSAGLGRTVLLDDCTTSNARSTSLIHLVPLAEPTAATFGLPTEDVSFDVVGENMMRDPFAMETVPTEMDMEMMQLVTFMWPCLRMFKVDQELAFVLNSAIPSHYED